VGLRVGLRVGGFVAIFPVLVFPVLVFPVLAVLLRALWMLPVL
jgi:hypothetical protein